MRVLVLGGRGEVGGRAVAELRELSGIDRVTVADRSAPDGPDSIVLDVTDSAALKWAIDACDVVVNCTGPYFRLGPLVLDAAIAARTTYVDICDDPEPTLAMLARDKRATAGGVTALLGMGASPGVSNLLAIRAAAELDEVDEVVTGWSIEVAVPGGSRESAALSHGIEQLSGRPLGWKEGRLRHTTPLRPVVLRYPGIGTIKGRSFGHPEAVTLHRSIPGLRTSTNATFGKRSSFAALAAVKVLVDTKVLSHRRAARWGSALERRMASDPRDSLRPGAAPPLFALAKGLHDGRPATSAVALAQVPGLTMADNTAVPLAVTVPLLAGLDRPGVHTPDTLINPSAFFDAFSERCIGRPAPTHMTVTTRSWIPEAENTAALRDTSILTSLLAERIN